MEKMETNSKLKPVNANREKINNIDQINKFLRSKLQKLFFASLDVNNKINSVDSDFTSALEKLQTLENTLEEHATKIRDYLKEVQSVEELLVTKDENAIIAYTFVQDNFKTYKREIIECIDKFERDFRGIGDEIEALELQRKRDKEEEYKRNVENLFDAVNEMEDIAAIEIKEINDKVSKGANEQDFIKNPNYQMSKAYDLLNKLLTDDSAKNIENNKNDAKIVTATPKNQSTKAQITESTEKLSTEMVRENEPVVESKRKSIFDFFKR